MYEATADETAYFLVARSDVSEWTGAQPCVQVGRQPARRVAPEGEPGVTVVAQPISPGHRDSSRPGSPNRSVSASPASRRRPGDRLQAVLSDDAADAFREHCRGRPRRDRVRARSGRTRAGAELADDEFFVIDDPETLAELAVIGDLRSSIETMPVIKPADLDLTIQLYAVAAGSDHRVLFVRRTNPQAPVSAPAASSPSGASDWPVSAIPRSASRPGSTS